MADPHHRRLKIVRLTGRCRRELMAEGAALRGGEGMTEKEREVVAHHHAVHGTIYEPRSAKYKRRSKV